MKKIVLLILLFLSISHADEIRPAYLELNQKQENIFSLIFKVPAKGDKRLSLEVKLPQECSQITPKKANFIKGAYIEKWDVKCNTDLRNKNISVEGLQNTNTDLLLRLEFLDNSSQTAILKSTCRNYLVKEKASSFQIIKTYVMLGIEHILMGYDHLLFVFALLLIVKNIKRLLWTISAFTLAHSITMAGATLGLVHIPQPAVEAVIALSILFLAIELIYEKKDKQTLTFKYPWLIAFIFGLLHGFGFAGALAEIGLPQHAITLALVFFNIGVEIGQLLFVSAVVLLTFSLSNYKNNKVKIASKKVMIYIIGALSSFWLIERVVSF